MTRSIWTTWALGIFLIGCGEQAMEPVRGDSGVGGSTGGSGGTGGVGGGTGGSVGGSGGSAGAGGAAGAGGTGSWVQEACLNAAAPAPPIWLNAIRLKIGTNVSSSAGMVTQLTSEPRRCQWKAIDDHCSIVDCLTKDWTGAAASMHGPSAGKLTVSNAKGVTLQFAPDAEGIYSVQYQGAGWSAGDSITYAAEGSEIPAFTQHVAIPDALTGVQMPLADAGTPQIDLAVPLVASWDPTDAKVVVDIARSATTAESGDHLELTCVFDGSAGTGTVPLEALQALQPGVFLQTGIGIAHMAQTCSTLAGFHLQANATEGLWWYAVVK